MLETPAENNLFTSANLVAHGAFYRSVETEIYTFTISHQPGNYVCWRELEKLWKSVRMDLVVSVGAYQFILFPLILMKKIRLQFYITVPVIRLLL